MSALTGRVLYIFVVLTGLKVGEGGVTGSGEGHHLGNRDGGSHGVKGQLKLTLHVQPLRVGITYH